MTTSITPAAARQERDCPWCAERILVQARICKHCQRSVEHGARMEPSSAPSLHARSAPPAPRAPGLAAALTHVPRWLSNRSPLMLVGGVAGLLLGCYLVKHTLTFSVTNFTLFLLMPIGPMLLGMALVYLFGPQQPGHEVKWNLALGLAVIAVFFGDQYIAYLHDGEGLGFWNWYPYIVEHRGMWLKARGGAAQSIDQVGGFGWVLEAIKIGGVGFMLVWDGWDELKRRLRR